MSWSRWKAGSQGANHNSSKCLCVDPWDPPSELVFFRIELNYCVRVSCTELTLDSWLEHPILNRILHINKFIFKQICYQLICSQLFPFFLVPIPHFMNADKWLWLIVTVYDSFSDVGESRVCFASKNLTPCRMQWNAFLIGGSVRSESGLSPGRCNFSRFLECGFPWPNIFQLLYHNVVREDFTKKITCFKRFYRCPTSLGSVHTYVRVSWCRNIIKSFQYSLRIFVCYAN